MTNSYYKLEVIKKNNSDLIEYTNKVEEWVKETEEKSKQKEINKIKNDYYIDHCWILNNENEKVGVVKIWKNTFYQLGLNPLLNMDQFPKILRAIETDISVWGRRKIEATVNSEFIDYMKKVGYSTNFSREKMELIIKPKAKVIDDPRFVIQSYHKKYFDEIVETYIDAYSNTVDERIGMFGVSFAKTAIRRVTTGDFGEFVPKMSPIAFSKENNEIIGALLTSISEENPFIVIIGVRKKYQNIGVGSNLISWLIKQSLEKNYQKLRLWVTTENTGAKKLYKTIGFETIDKIYNMYKTFA